MLLLTILALAFGASLKATLQGYFGKHNVKTLDDSVFFFSMVFASSTIVAALFGNMLAINTKTVIAGFAFGFSSVIFQLIYLKTMSDGPVSMTVMFSNFGAIIPMLVSVIFFDETLTKVKIIGLVLVCISILLNAFLKEEKKATGKWFSLALATFLFSGIMVTVQRIASSSLSKSETVNFVAVSYAFATVITLLIYLFRKKFMSGKRTFKFNVGVFLSVVAIGAILSAVQVYLTRAIEQFGALILLPGYNSGTTVMVFLIGLVLYKEKHSPIRWLSAFLGLIAIIFLSL